MWGALSSWTGFQLRPCREGPVGVRRVGVGVLGVKQLNDASGSQAAWGEPLSGGWETSGLTSWGSVIGQSPGSVP